MDTDQTTFQLLYVSQLARGADTGVVKQIVTVARDHNPARGISGALLFDGERFCQLLEGGEADVNELMQRIAEDPRHAAIAVLYAARSAATPCTKRWVSGYCDVAALEPFESLSGPAALEAFLHVLHSADVE